MGEPWRRWDKISVLQEPRHWPHSSCHLPQCHNQPIRDQYDILSTNQRRALPVTITSTFSALSFSIIMGMVLRGMNSFSFLSIFFAATAMAMPALPPLLPMNSVAPVLRFQHYLALQARESSTTYLTASCMVCPIPLILKLPPGWRFSSLRKTSLPRMLERGELWMRGVSMWSLCPMLLCWQLWFWLKKSTQQTWNRSWSTEYYKILSRSGESTKWSGGKEYILHLFTIIEKFKG